MGLSIYNIKKWMKMLTGNSILHVNQGVGKVYSTTDVKGYYNDLTEKVTKDRNYDEVRLPTLKLENGDDILFPIAIFQYGLGAYDLFLLERKSLFFDKFKICVDWTYDNQENNGAWKTFYFKQPDYPYSSMAQGEGVSLLVRAYKEFNDEKYLRAAKKAVNFLITSIETEGTTKYVNNEVFFQEYVNKPTVLNGWIFSLFGLHDYLKIINDKNIRDIYNRSIQTLVSHMKDFDNGYWSKYDIDNMITSPFYHRLHIAQLEVMYQITGEEIFKEYSNKWSEYQNKWFNRKRAFLVKVYQKLIDK